MRTHDYTNEELLDKEDEMSLLMMINKAQSPQEMEHLLNSHKERITSIIEKASEQMDVQIYKQEKDKVKKR